MTFPLVEGVKSSEQARQEAGLHRTERRDIHMVGTGTMIVMGLLAVLTAVVPLGVMLLLRRRGGRWGAFWTGAGTFFLFALVLEAMFHQLVLGSPLGAAIRGNIWLYALYGGLAAGIFEETGRLLAFRLMLRRRRERITALAYGIGHGGGEAFLLLGVTYLSNLVLLALLQSGAALPPEITAALEPLAAVPVSAFLWAGFERVGAITLHMACSVLVFAAAAGRGRRWLFPAAVLLHFAADFVTVIAGARLPIAATELLVALWALLAAVLAARVYKNLEENPEMT